MDGLRAGCQVSTMRTLLSIAAAVLAVAAYGSPARAGFVPGGGNAAADCYLGLDVTGVTTSGKRIECTEGDPCDVGACGDQTCTFRFDICVNQAGVSGCTVPAGGLSSVKAPGPLQAFLPADVTGAACGTPYSFDLRLKKNGTKQNKRAIRMRATALPGTKPRKDQDSFLFVCLPRTGDCPSSPSAAFLP